MAETYCVVLTTSGSREEAENIAEVLVTRKLAACVQITNISSFYIWDGELHKEPEHLLLIKTAAHRYADVEAAILQNHSYEVPEIVQLPIMHGLASYLGWVTTNTG